MKKSLLALTLMCLAAAVFSEQGPVRLLTHPKIPLHETLDRLDLIMAWTTKVPVEGVHDGFSSLQLFPGKNFTLLVAQTHKGSVVAINAENGDILWRTPVGLPYRSQQPVGASDQAIFACRSRAVFALDRETGKQLLYTVDPASSLPDYGQQLQTPPSAGPAATDEFLFVCCSDQLLRFAVPNFRAAAKQQPLAKGPPAPPEESPQLIRTWGLTTSGILSQTPILTRDSVVVATDAGMLSVVKKVNPTDDTRPDVWLEFKTDGVVSAAAASRNDTIYIPCHDYFLYALNTQTGRQPWRFAGQAPLLRGPTATDADVFVPAGKGRLYRLERSSGAVKWSNADAVKFLATNQRFVYSLDRFGKMLVLDYDRGKTLAAWDARDWTLSVPNDMTDRIYLASNDGQILCLRHRDNLQPMRLRRVETLEPKAKSVEKKAADKSSKTENKSLKDKDDKDDKDKIRLDGAAQTGGLWRATDSKRMVWRAASAASSYLPRWPTHHFREAPLTIRRFGPDFWDC